jgi:hypothetical protein
MLATCATQAMNLVSSKVYGFVLVPRSICAEGGGRRSTPLEHIAWGTRYYSRHALNIGMHIYLGHELNIAIYMMHQNAYNSNSQIKKECAVDVYVV